MIEFDLNPVTRWGPWAFRITETVDGFEHVSTYPRECIEWTIKQLSNLSYVKRVTYNLWYFDDFKEAEKFLIFCKLKWVYN